MHRCETIDVRAEHNAINHGIYRDFPTHYVGPRGTRFRVGFTFESATLDGSPGAMRYRFHARDLHLVLGGAADGKPVRFRVTIDGAAPGASHGVDVDAAGWGEVQQDRLYQLVRQSGTIGDRTVRIEFARPGVRAYVFTFG